MIASYYYDWESKLYDLKARFYDAKLARFLQEDTYYGSMQDPLSLNLYTYCFNNPLTYWDPTGHSAELLMLWSGISSGDAETVGKMKSEYEALDRYEDKYEAEKLKILEEYNTLKTNSERLQQEVQARTESGIHVKLADQATANKNSAQVMTNEGIVYGGK